VPKLAELTEASENLVADALHELREKDLLTAEPELMQSTIPGISRREAISRAARYGAAAAAGSLIVSATAATPAMASSGEGVACCSCTTSAGARCWCTSSSISLNACKMSCETNAGPTCNTPTLTPLALCSGGPNWICS
jgi:hypothetical protein